MNKENERITYEEFMTMFKFAPRMCYTLYVKAEDEIENLQKKAELGEHYKHLYSEVKKRNDNAIKFLKSIEMDKTDKYIPIRDYKEFGILLRKLGETDVED